METPSRSSVQKACSRIRNGIQMEGDSELLSLYRDRHISALGPLIPELVGCVASVSTIVTGRLKRMESIVRKVIRQRTSIASMDDLVGIRIIVRSLEEQERICQILRAHAGWVQSRDYRYLDRESGYRASHEIIAFSDDSGKAASKFRLEIQVRTVLQDLWANLSEALGQQVKEGGGPALLREALVHLSAEIDRLERTGDNQVLENLALDSGNRKSYYLLLFNGTRRKFEDIIDFNGFVNRAIDSLRALEIEQGNRGGREVVLLYSSSVGMVEFTHSRYFPDILLKRFASNSQLQIPDFIVRQILEMA